MSFQTVPTPETAQKYLDMAVNEARSAANRQRDDLEGSGLNRVMRSRRLESTKVTVMALVLERNFLALVKGFPSIDSIDIFYRELARCTIDVDGYKKALGALQWAAGTIGNLARETVRKVRGSADPAEMNHIRSAFLGRASSVVKRVAPDLKLLKLCAAVIRRFPSIKTKQGALIICGFPNVGKSTLLNTFTGSAPKAAPYPFTTKQLMIGNTTLGDETLQVIDTPGLLDRPLEKRNKIERQAALALKHLARIILFIIDPTDVCGYPLSAQIALLKDIREHFDVPCIVALNKMDRVSEQERAAADAAVPKGVKAVWISAEHSQGLDTLRDTLIAALPPKSSTMP